MGYMYKKPESDRVRVEKIRKCLVCRKDYLSRHTSERICPKCKDSLVWRSSGRGIAN